MSSHGNNRESKFKVDRAACNVNPTDIIIGLIKGKARIDNASNLLEQMELRVREQIRHTEWRNCVSTDITIAFEMENVRKKANV